MTEYHIGDPVVDLAQGRPMVVLDAPELTVTEWSDANGYDLQGNYANSKFDPADDEAVVECVYVSDVRSEPSKTYTFPASRVALIDAHHADDGRRVYQRVAVALVASFLATVPQSDYDEHTWALQHFKRVLPDGVVEEAAELADVERTIGGDA